MGKKWAKNGQKMGQKWAKSPKIVINTMRIKNSCQGLSRFLPEQIATHAFQTRAQIAGFEPTMLNFGVRSRVAR
jgi:hypothetical protein